MGIPSYLPVYTPSGAGTEEHPPHARRRSRIHTDSQLLTNTVLFFFFKFNLYCIPPLPPYHLIPLYLPPLK